MILKGCSITQSEFTDAAHSGADEVIFENCDFAGVSVEKLQFQASLTLINCRASEEFLVKYLIVDGELRVERCSFLKQVRIENAIIEGNVYFDRTEFNEDVHLSESSFSANFVLESCHFHRYVSLRSCSFQEYVWLHNCDFEGYFSQLDAAFRRESFFDRCTFHRVNTFDRSNFSRNVSFFRCKFLHAPTFFDVNVREGLHIEDCNFTDFTSSDAIHGYRQIKHLFNNQKSKRDEAKFYVFEQDAILHGQKGFIEFIVVILYRATSNYGTNLNKCIYTLFAVNLIALLYYYMQFDDLCRAFDFLLSQLFNPFGIWKDKDHLSFGFGLRIAATLQSLAVLSSLLFLGLALGWRFKKE